MTFFEIIYTLLIGPLKLLFEIIYEAANRYVDNPGLAIIFLSLIMNILVLPLYKRADYMQEQARDIDAKLSDGVAHIKKTFSGEEKMLMLQTYYRQNHYKPADVLRGSVSLLLEIPFFIAAYQFLSHLESLNGVSFGPVEDLSRPDGMLVIGGFAINLLPIIMTSINLISSFLYLKGFPVRTKVQLYGMALFFLIFLYGSPSGLVFYWTLNNLFSLFKTIFYKLKKHFKTSSIIVMCALAANIVLITCIIKFYNPPLLRQKYFIFFMAVLMEILLGIWVVVKIRSELRDVPNLENPQSKCGKIRQWTESPNNKIFDICMLFMTVFIGILIPSTYISDSPHEYIDIVDFHHPIWYIAASAIMAAGTFLVWMKVFYWLANPQGKVIFERLAWIFCGLAVVNYMFFGTKLGNISATLQYDKGMNFSVNERILNVLVLIFIAGIMYFIVYKWSRITLWITVTASMALAVMSLINIFNIKASVDKVSFETPQTEQLFSFSTEGRNVVVIMLDRGMGEYIPYIMNENPKLQEQFAGFTYYSNTISFGRSTLFGIPALLGGYEYTPVEMNRRADESLIEKHNEAIKVMPVLFLNNGFDVTVCDPVFVNYELIPDLSVFDEYPDINAYITNGMYDSDLMHTASIESYGRRFFCFSLMKGAPLIAQRAIYADGTYNQTVNEELSLVQILSSMSCAKGINPEFMDSYNVLCNLSNITVVTDKNTDTFLFLSNDTTHEPTLLQEPEYVPKRRVDNTEYDAQNADRFTLNGKILKMEDIQQIRHYHVNMAALMKLGEWFDYLRENGVYDNTKIIIASDHGYPLGHSDELIHDASDELKDVELYYPLLLVKDFGSTEFSVSDEFMTNADVPVLAADGLIENPINPFTGKEITNDEKNAHAQYIILGVGIDKDADTFQPARWARVKDNLWDRSNWEYYDEKVILDEYVFPNDNIN